MPLRAVDIVVQRFPDRVDLIRRLYLQDADFRAICEDLALSVTSLRRFEARPDAKLRPEVDEYRQMVHELCEELRAYLESTDLT